MQHLFDWGVICGVSGQFVVDNSSQTIRRGQFVAKYDINVTVDL